MIEANFDGIVGPTHNYAGLSYGNVASRTNEGAVSRPREAALQGLHKMRYLANLGLVQGVLPPQERPHIPTLRRLGFSGSDTEVMESVASTEPHLLALCSSASSMWAANAATVAPSPDTSDGRVHFTPANLCSTLHRSIEPTATGRILRRLFPEGPRFAHHRPLPGQAELGDEGAANHTRLTSESGTTGVHLFVYGRSGLAASSDMPRVFPARQTLAASQAVSRLHGLSADRTFFLQQNPQVIDAGVFHNDVIAVGHANVLLYHEDAFVDADETLDGLRRALDGSLVLARIDRREASVEEMVRSYLFNSQLLTLPNGAVVLIAPTDCQASEPSRRVIDRLIADKSPISGVHYLDVRQSMRNGGGPACLRLRVALTEQELPAVHGPCLVNDELLDRLTAWVTRNYREELAPEDLADPQLLTESRTALDELTQILELGSLYEFQQHPAD